MPTVEEEVQQALASLEVAFGSKKEGDLDAARVFFSRAALKLPKTHDSYPICLAQLAEIDEAGEDWLGALRFNLNLLIDMEQRFGERDESTIAVMDKTASLFDKLGRKDESVALYERARTLSQRSLWADQALEDFQPSSAANSISVKANDSVQISANQGSSHPELAPTSDDQSSKATDATISAAGSAVMLEAFENAYKPYLTPELIGPEDISLDYLDRKMNLKGRLSKMRMDAEEKEKKDEEEREKLLAKLRAQLAKLFAPLLGFFSQYLSDRNKILLALFAGVVMLIGLAYVIIKSVRDVESFAQYDHVPHFFVSADGQKSFSWTDKHTCELISGANRLKVRTRVYRGNPATLVELALTPLMQKQLFLNFDSIQVVDESGGVMYADIGPESRLLQDLQGIIRGASFVYAANKKYPTSLSQIVQALKEHEKRDLPCKNQFTGADERPEIKLINYKAKDDRDGDQWRTELLWKLKRGELLEAEEKFNPGEPRIYSITDKMPRGTIEYFVVRAAGRDGKILNGNRANEFNYAVLDEGKELKPEKSAPFFDTGLEIKPRVAWILQRPISDAEKLFLRGGGAALCFAFFMVFAAIYLSTYKNSLWRGLSLLLAIGMLLLSIGYYVSPFIP